MKKTLLFLFVILTGVFAVKAQINMYANDFETDTIGRLAIQEGAPWTTWSLAPGGAEDPFVSSTQAHSGVKSVYVVNANDCVFQLNDKTTGRYMIEWYMFVETGKLGYFNLLSDFNGNSSKWAFQAYIYNDSIFIDADGTTKAKVPFTINTWVKIHLIIDLDDDFATFYKDDIEVISYKWSKGAQGTDNSLKLDGINFYGWNGVDSPAAGGSSGYYIDDISVDSLPAPESPLNLDASINGNDIDVSWTAPSTPPDLYKLSRDGAVVYETGGLSYTDEGLWPNKYFYVVRARYNELGYSHSSNTDSVKILGGVSRNLVLMEEGTGTWCVYCPGAAMGLRDLIDVNQKDAVAIAYHYNDTYQNSFALARLDYYNDTVFPTVIADGNGDGFSRAVGGSATVSQYGTYLPIYNRRIANPGFHYLDVNVVQTGPDAFTATITAVQTFNAFTPVKIYAVLTESNIAEVWGNQTECDFVCRAMYPDVNGTTVDFETSNPQTVTVNFTTTGYVKDNCEFVVFIQDDVTHEVTQAAKVDMSGIVGFEEISGNKISIYPNPANEYFMALTSGNGFIEIYDITAKLVMRTNITKNSETIDIRDLQKGVYFVKVTTKENTFTKKLIVE